MTSQTSTFLLTWRIFEFWTRSLFDRISKFPLLSPTVNRDDGQSIDEQDANPSTMVRVAALVGFYLLLVGRAGAFHFTPVPVLSSASNRLSFRTSTLGNSLGRDTAHGKGRIGFTGTINKYETQSKLPATRYTSFQSSLHRAPSYNEPLPGVIGLMLAQVGVFLVDTMTKTRFIKRKLYFWHAPPGIRPWQPFTSLFCHNNFVHLGGNLISTFLVGRSVQEEFGTKGLLLSFALCGIASSLVSLACLPARTVTMGSAGALLGVYLMSQIGYYTSSLGICLYSCASELLNNATDSIWMVSCPR